MSLILGCIAAFLGLVSILYGTAIAFGAHGSMFFIIWFIIGAVFIIDGVLRIRRLLHPSLFLNITRVIVLLLFALFLFVEACIMTKFNSKAQNGADYLIVAGAQVYENGPSPVLKFRLDTAAKYLKDNPDTICIVTGGKGSNEVRPEAVVMAEYLVSKGISSDRILTETLSSTTTENMKNAADLFDAQNSTAVIVTSNFHLFRTMRIARKQGINVSSGLAAPTTALYLPNNLLREFCGICKDFLFGHL